MAHIEQDADKRTRACVICEQPYGKWTCCGEAFCNKCILTHNKFHGEEV